MHPKINIVVRTCKRPKYFQYCMDTIFTQQYDNFLVWVGIENGDNETLQYVNHFINYGGSPFYFNDIKSKISIVQYDKIINKKHKPLKSFIDYGHWFPYNHYLDIISKKVRELSDGIVMFLDDDDCLKDENALQIIADNIKANDLLFWRVKFPDGRLIPEDKYWKMLKDGLSPYACQVSGIGFCYNTRFIEDVEWGYWTLGDYRVAKRLFELCDNKIFIDKVLTGMQDVQHLGKIIDMKIDKK